MSAESQIRALLAGHAPLAALVGNRIVQNVMQQGQPAPFVAFTTRHDLTRNLLGEVVADDVSITLQCWGRTALEADQVADAAEQALSQAPADVGAAVISRDTGYDEPADLHATILALSWWQL